MTTADRVHRFIVFDPELDLENEKELPGRKVMEGLHGKHGESAPVSRLVHDSHGWCFQGRDDQDRRSYLIELSYVGTEAGESDWMLSCSRSAGWRIWEFFGGSEAEIRPRTPLAGPGRLRYW